MNLAPDTQPFIFDAPTNENLLSSDFLNHFLPLTTLLDDFNNVRSVLFSFVVNLMVWCHLYPEDI